MYYHLIALILIFSALLVFRWLRMPGTPPLLREREKKGIGEAGEEEI